MRGGERGWGGHPVLQQPSEETPVPWHGQPEGCQWLQVFCDRVDLEATVLDDGRIASGHCSHDARKLLREPAA